MDNQNLEKLKRYLPKYLGSIARKRRHDLYNCPFCGSGTGKKGTPALSLYENGMKWKCFSCGKGGDIINLFYEVNHMADTPENFKYAVKTLSEEFHLVSATASETTAAKSTTPKVKIGERQHIYHNADGSIFGMKVVNKFSDGSKNAVWYLFEPKTGRFRKESGLNGQKAPLYNADTLHSNQDEPVYIVEGEKDADTLTNWDAVATTFPNGAGFTQWIPLYNEGLKDREVIILTDNDDSGRKYGNTIARNLLNIAKSVKIIPAAAIWNKCPEKGDITDIAQSIGEEEAQEFLISAIQRTSFCTPESLPKIEKSNTAPMPTQPEIEYTFVRLSDVKPEKQEFLWNPYIPIGEITVMYAAGGTGKSYATIGIAADITTGRSLPGYGIEKIMVNPEKVLFISAEDNESIILNRMREAGGNPDNCFVLKTPKTRKDLDTASFLLPQNKDDTARIQAFARLLEQIHPKLVIIDPWSVYIGDDKNMNKANDVRGVTNVLTVLAKEYDCAILVVAHVNKMPQTENANNAVSGSTALIDSARSALCIRSFGADSDRRVIIQTKSNYQKKAKSVCYQIVNQGENRTARFEWDGFSDLTEDDLTAAARSGKKLTDIASEKEDDAENTANLVEIITKLAEINKKIPISYNRLRTELIENYGIDFLGNQPKKELYKALSDLRTRGIGIEFAKGAIKGLAEDGTYDKTTNRGFYICCLTDGSLMASALPK